MPRALCTEEHGNDLKFGNRDLFASKKIFDSVNLERIKMLIIAAFGFFLWKFFIRPTVEQYVDSCSIQWPDHESQAMQSLYFQMDLGDKIMEMINDPFTNDSDWYELLPVCRFSDNWYAATHCFPRMTRKEEWVLSILNKDEEEVA